MKLKTGKKRSKSILNHYKTGKLKFVNVTSNGCEGVLFLYLEQGSANCGPRAKCGPQSQNLWPAKYFLAKSILFKADVTQYENFATTFSPCKINFLAFIDFNHRPGMFL